MASFLVVLRLAVKAHERVYSFDNSKGESVIDFKFYISIFWRRFPYFILLVSIGCAAGLTAAVVLPPVYVASARLVVESEQIPDELAASTVKTGASEQLEIIKQRILTRENLLEMANRLGIYRGAGARTNTMTPDETVQDLRTRISIVTQGGSVARGQTTATIVQVGFDAPTAQMASIVANEIVTLILQENIEMRTSVSGQTLEFFTQEVTRLEQSLAQLSGQILEFKQANQEALPDSLEFRRSQQAAAQERLLEQERNENILRDRRDRLIALYEATGSVSATSQGVTRTPEEIQLQGLRDQLSTSVAVLSLDNPRVVVLRAQIAALEAIVAEQMSAVAGSSSALDGEPMTPYDLQLSDLDGQLAFIADQKSQINDSLAVLAASIAATPSNELTLGTLEQNYANLRIQYDQAVTNRARAETGDMIEAMSRGERISIIEQAVPPNAPTSPNRKKVAMLGGIGGLGMGFGFILLLELLNTAVRRPIDIVQGLDITPIMTLPFIRTRREIWRKRLTVFGLIVLLSAGVSLMLWYVDTNIRPLQSIFDEIAQRVGLS